MDLQLLESVQRCNKLLHNDKHGKEVLEKLLTYMQGGKWKQRFAICILNCVLRKCDVEVFEENATSWMRFVLQLINTVPSENLLNLCFVSLKEILICASNVDKVHREIATKAIDPLLALLVGSSLPASPQKLNMIQCCIRNFPGPCGQYRCSIEKLLIGAIEGDDQFLCSSACQMFTLLAICGTAGEKNNSFVHNWVSQFYKLINTSHFYCSKLNKLSDVADGKCFDVEESCNFIPFSEISEGSEIDVSTTLQRIERLLLILQHFISTAMSFEVAFPLLKVVNLFCEVSNMLYTQEKRLATFHVSLLKVTLALLSCITITVNQFKTILIPFFHQLSKILKSTVSSSYLTHRTSAYACVINMVNHWKVFPQTLNFVESVLIWIFTDIKIEKCFSSVEESSTNSKRDDHTHTLADDINKHIKKEINHFNYAACENACAALELLERLLILNGPVLPVDNINSVITNILNVFVKLYGKEGFLSPYNCGENRLLLCKIAKCLITLQHACVEIPISILLSYLNIAASEPSGRVRCFCQDVLLQYDSIIHPINVTFYGNTPASIQRDLNGNYSEDTEIKIKSEPISRPNSNEAIVLSVNNSVVNNSVVNNSVVNNGDYRDKFTCSCGSADQVREIPKVLPVRSFSEPTEIYQNQSNLSNMVRSNDNSLPNLSAATAMPRTDNSSTDVGYSENSSLIVSNEVDSAHFYDDSIKEDDDTVVISDSSEEDTPPHSGIQEKFQPAPRNSCVLLEPPPTHVESMYSPTAKKAKLSSNNGRVNDGYHEDPEYIAILDTFCEIDADD